MSPPSNDSGYVPSLKGYAQPEMRIPKKPPRKHASKPYTLNPQPATLNRKLWTFTGCPWDRPGSYDSGTLNPTPDTLRPTPYTLHPTPYTLHTRPYTLHLTYYTLPTTHYTLHTTHYTLHTTHYTLHTTL